MDKIKLDHLQAGYGGNVILHDINMTVAHKEIRVILGGSGCGKSTLLNNIIGLETPMGGKVEIMGVPIDYQNSGIPLEVRKKMGVTFQGSALMSSMTVAENIALPLKIHNPDIPDGVLKEIVEQKLIQVHLERAYAKYPSELSGGMKKRVAVARAIVTNPDLLFCDEPSAGLDPLTSKSLDDLLLELRETLDLSIVIVTHELDSIRAICDKLTFLAGGYVLFDGTISEALEHGPEQVKWFFARKTEAENLEASHMTFNLED